LKKVKFPLDQAMKAKRRRRKRRRGIALHFL
jgi:hypothetical protein